MHGLAATGVVDGTARRIAAPQGFIPFLQARNFGPSLPSREISLLVVHDMEYPERPEGAEWCAQFFAGANAPRASCHYCVDSNSVVQCVRDRDVAWHAPGGNHNGIGIEHAGYAKQSREEWLDDYSRAELEISARLTAKLSLLYDIPLRRLTDTDLKAGGARGFCGHVDLTLASGKPGHFDPGPHFPWSEYLDLVRQALARDPT